MARIPFSSATAIAAKNADLLAKLRFRDSEEAFEWIRDNRDAVRSKEEGELSLSYIAVVLDVAGKLNGMNAQALRRRCGAYDNYLYNKELIDRLEFKDEMAAFEWIRDNRDAVRSKEEGELSLSYIAVVLDVAGKLNGMNAQALQRRCGAYDFFKAKEHFFANAIRNFFKRNENAGAAEFRKWCLGLLDFPTATLLHQLKGGKTISKPYLRLILTIVGDDYFDQIKRARPGSPSAEDINELRQAYTEALRKIEKKRAIGSAEIKRAIKRKRREVKLALNALSHGVRLEQKAFRKIASGA
ncbi:MAG: hypothetical protein QW171_04095 [Candidatus Bilamarchaeaceae archaeon]